MTVYLNAFTSLFKCFLYFSILTKVNVPNFVFTHKVILKMNVFIFDDRRFAEYSCTKHAYYFEKWHII